MNFIRTKPLNDVGTNVIKLRNFMKHEIGFCAYFVFFLPFRKKHLTNNVKYVASP